MGKKILIVEDEKDLQRLLKYNLEKEGFEYVAVSDGEAGLKALRQEKPDLVVLDIMLPKLNGFDFCRQARQESAVPIIILTARSEELDKVLGLELGADDYVTKPFSIRELLARIKAVLRRERSLTGQEKIIRCGLLEADLERHEIRVNGKVVSLSPKEFEFLKCLLLANGKTLTRDQLLEKVWGYDQSFEIDTRTVDQHIARLRERLGTESARVLTVKNVGYRFRLDH